MALWPDVAGYRILDDIGRGGFAVVYRAEQLSLKREVALKVLSVLDMTEAEVARFTVECETLAQLDWHPNILRILEAGVTTEGRPFLAMELMEAGSVEGRMRSGPMSVDEVVAVGSQIASALAAAHQIGVLHRDVKPANILVDRTGKYRLADFGIAGVVGSTRASAKGPAGTIGFMAPEVLGGGKASQRSDVYSLGATMHALLTGVDPFVRADDETTMAAMLRSITEEAADLRPFGVPDWLRSVVEAAMRKSPEDRIRSAEELARHLESRTGAPSLSRVTTSGEHTLPSGQPPAPSAESSEDKATVRAVGWPAPSAAGNERRRRRQLIGISALLVCLTLGGLVVANGMKSNEARTSNEGRATPSAESSIQVEQQGPVPVPSGTTGPPLASSSSAPADSTSDSAATSISATSTTVPIGGSSTTVRPSPGPLPTTPGQTSLPSSPTSTVAQSAPTTTIVTTTTRPATTTTTRPQAATTTTATTTTSAPARSVQITGLSGSVVGGAYVFQASPGTSRCQEREVWTVTGPVTVTRDSGFYPFDCYTRDHTTTPAITGLVPGTYTVTLALYVNGAVGAQRSIQYTVPSPATTTTAAPRTVQITGLSGYPVAGGYVFQASPGTSRCQEREVWTITGPVSVTRDSGFYAYDCYVGDHTTTPAISGLVSGTYTVTLTLYVNGGVGAQRSIQYVVP